MRSHEAEPVCHRTMVENGIVPSVDIMAFQARRRKAGAAVLVLIVGLMAGKTVVLVHRLEQGIEAWRWRMAGRARQRLVRTHKRETIRDGSMLEIGIVPDRCIMTLDAGGRKSRSGMRSVIVGLMARLAIVLVGRLE